MFIPVPENTFFHQGQPWHYKKAHSSAQCNGQENFFVSNCFFFRYNNKYSEKKKYTQKTVHTLLEPHRNHTDDTDEKDDTDYTDYTDDIYR